VGAKHPDAEVEDVHRTALSPARPCLLPVELGHHRVYADTLRDAVTVAPVRAGDVIVIPEVRTDPDWDRLLSDGEVDEPRELSRREYVSDRELEVPYQKHPAKEAV